jgi:hypothetical protein
MSPAEIASESRQSQGLPPTIDDPTTLHRIAVLTSNDEGVRDE